jgi:hypothetical protein
MGEDVLLSCEHLNDLVIIRSSDSPMQETTISSERRQAIRRRGVAIDDSSSEIASTIPDSAGSITSGGSLKYGSRASSTTSLHRHLSRPASPSVFPRGHLVDISCGVEHQADCS